MHNAREEVHIIMGLSTCYGRRASVKLVTTDEVKRKQKRFVFEKLLTFHISWGNLALTSSTSAEYILVYVNAMGFYK